jgi:hypothetical protein
LRIGDFVHLRVGGGEFMDPIHYPQLKHAKYHEVLFTRTLFFPDSQPVDRHNVSGLPAKSVAVLRVVLLAENMTTLPVQLVIDSGALGPGEIAVGPCPNLVALNAGFGSFQSSILRTGQRTC